MLNHPYLESLVSAESGAMSILAVQVLDVDVQDKAVDRGISSNI